MNLEERLKKIYMTDTEMIQRIIQQLERDFKQVGSLDAPLHCKVLKKHFKVDTVRGYANYWIDALKRDYAYEEAHIIRDWITEAEHHELSEVAGNQQAEANITTL